MAEANDLVRGLYEKETREAKIIYNAHRFTSSIIHKTLTGHDPDIRFSWEKEDEREEEEAVSEEEVARLREHYRKLNAEHDTLDDTIQGA